ncbi:DUF167 domain-containing protein [Pseudothauera rhizosphaerae]|uniref:UPF0235 protein E6O51_10715 n=1 Tax=Pseudothauera rhizosphaerae TaxID=2565932 RepID=A0A4S4ANQ6_9RHOO|nr:DUF167 family protein [Pseudothauera rhizosphaerae]THF61286.1 YggU family protein [Pseudothauera rhizosphaerae]
MSGPWLRQADEDCVVLTLHVQPNARHTEFAGLHGEAMKLRLAAPPVDGKANTALCAFLAQFCEVPRSAVSLLSGESSRAKRVRIEGVDDEVLRRLRRLG